MNRGCPLIGQITQNDFAWRVKSFPCHPLNQQKSAIQACFSFFSPKPPAMKKTSIYIWTAMLVGLAIILGGCEGNTYIKPKTEELNISDAQLFEFVTEALDASAMGLTYDIETAAILAGRYLDRSGMASFCSTQIDSTISYAYADEAKTMGYEGLCHWIVYCGAESVPQSIDFYNHLMCDYKSTEVPRLSSTTGVGDWTITTDSGTDQLLLSGDYIRDGYYKLGPEWDNAYYYKITFDIGTIAVGADKRKLGEGIIPFEGYIKDVTVTGISPAKEFDGQVEVKPDGSMMIMMGGSTYIL